MPHIDDDEDAAAPPRCPRCAAPEDDCECVLCGNCEDYEGHGCECLSCGHCGDNFGVDADGACPHCNYCARCIERGCVRHYACANCDRCLIDDADDNGGAACVECGVCEHCTELDCRDCSRCTSCCTCATTAPYIEEYSSKNYPDAIPPQRDVPASYLYIGVEVETEALGDDRDLAPIARAIHDKHAHEILMKEDGSLSNGIELVTGCYSLEAQQALWPRLCKTAIDNGLRSWKHETTGLHVHLSRRFFSALDIGKILVFINSPDVYTRKQIRRLAGRESNHYSNIGRKKITDYKEADSRYEAVNLTNSHTIEIRIFKGSLKAPHILADIEFCHAMAHWVQQCSIQEAEYWGPFWAYVNAQPKQYRHLRAFLDPTATLAEATTTETKKEAAAFITV